MIGYSIEGVKEDTTIDVVRDLAEEIWREHYSQIISSDQIEYMLNKYQSKEAIKEQIQTGYEYFVIKNQNKYAGYCSILINEEERKIFLSKIYVKREFRGLGLGSQMFNFINDIALSKNCGTIWLTVNRENISSVSVYKKRGFVIIKEANTPIGAGFFMNDYVMEYRIPGKYSRKPFYKE